MEFVVGCKWNVGCTTPLQHQQPKPMWAMLRRENKEDRKLWISPKEMTTADKRMRFLFSNVKISGPNDGMCVCAWGWFLAGSETHSIQN